MGFMDKLKGAGKNLAAKMATRYGTVTEGKYAKAEVALGNDPNATDAVSVAGRFTQVVFLNGSEEVGRETIRSGEIGMTVLGEKSNGKENVLEIGLRCADGKTSTIELHITSHDTVSNAVNLLSGSGSQTPEQRLEKKYHHLHTFLNTLRGVTTDESLPVIEKFAVEHEWNTVKAFEPYLEKIQERIAVLEKIRQAAE